MAEILRKPEWLKSKKRGAKNTQQLTTFLRKHGLHTVCESAQCPNKGECFERGTATFMLLGEICTRNCTFCAVNKDQTKLLAPDQKEPESIAKISKDLNLKHIVLTTVTRDDLPDGGTAQFVNTIHAIRDHCGSSVSIEVLISDLQGNKEDIVKIVTAKPDVLNHNIETINRLYSEVRPMANYHRSLELLAYAKSLNANLLTKSGFMVGLGESKEEVVKLLQDLRQNSVDIVTIGQYLAPSRKHFLVKEYVHPDTFEWYQKKGEELGFILVESGPLVRSSYHAEKAREKLTKFKKGE